MGPLKNRNKVAILGAGKWGRMWGQALGDSGIQVVVFVDIDPCKKGRTIRGIPIVSIDSVKRGLSVDFLIAAVGVPGARDQIRDFLHTLGLSEPGDFICVA